MLPVEKKNGEVYSIKPRSPSAFFVVVYMSLTFMFIYSKHKGCWKTERSTDNIVQMWIRIYLILVFIKCLSYWRMFEMKIVHVKESYV